MDSDQLGGPRRKSASMKTLEEDNRCLKEEKEELQEEVKTAQWLRTLAEKAKEDKDRQIKSLQAQLDSLSKCASSKPLEPY